MLLAQSSTKKVYNPLPFKNINNSDNIRPKVNATTSPLKHQHPFKVPVHLNIPVLQGKINVEALNEWFQLSIIGGLLHL